MSNPIADLVRHVEELRRRMENMIRPSQVAQVRHSDGMVKIRSGEWTSDWLPWTELSGGISTRNMPTVGQEVVGMFPSGDVSSGFVMPGQFTQTNPPPGAPNGESVFRRGQVTQTVTDGKFRIQAPEIEIVAGGVTFKFTGAGFEQTGGSQKHDGKNVGKDHKHSDVEPGGGQTGAPV